MSDSLSSSAILAAHFASAAGFTAVAGPSASREVSCKDGTKRTVESRPLISEVVEIDGEQWTLSFNSFRKCVELTRWTETPAQSKHNAKVRASRDEDEASAAADDIPA